MLGLILGMLLCVVLAVAVVGLVALPARRQGRELLTPKADEAVTRMRHRTGSAVDALREKSGEVLGDPRNKVADANPLQDP